MAIGEDEDVQGGQNHDSYDGGAGAGGQTKWPWWWAEA